MSAELQATESDLLLIGETHGTQEVPRLRLGLLPALAKLGCGGLVLEMPVGEREQLLRCAQSKDAPPPMFGFADFRDGRGNSQVLSLVQQAVQGGWERLCPRRKVLGVCGSYHSRLVPPTEPTEFWPSFAYSVQQARPDQRVSSIIVKHQCGAYFNGEVRTFDNGTEFCASQAEVHPAD